MRRFAILAVAVLSACALIVFAQDGDKKDDGDKKEKTETVAKTPNTELEVVKDEKAASDEAKTEKEIKWNTTKSGLKWVDLKEGEGTAAKNGDDVTVHYHLWLADEMGKGKSVQNSRDPQPNGKVQTFPFKVGDQRLIAGWNEGMVGMKEGGLRRLWIPSNLGYGSRAMGDMIPANSNLLFEIELLKLGKE